MLVAIDLPDAVPDILKQIGEGKLFLHTYFVTHLKSSVNCV